MGKLKLGKRNLLKVVRSKDHGMYLDGGEIGDILLPKRYIEPGTKVGDMVDVFLYLDQEERLVATTEHPYIEVGQFAYLECKWTNQYGAYLDWGLMKDLFCPFKEQKIRMQRGNRYQVYCYIDDKTYRIVCSSKIDKFQKSISEKENEKKEGRGARDDRRGRDERGSRDERGNRDERRDWRDTPADRTVLIGDFSARLFAFLKEMPDGKCSMHDKTPAEDIYATFGVSKKVFKQAIGDLYKRELIKINGNGIELTVKGMTEGEED